VTVLAIDPGRSDTKATIGYCQFNDDGTEVIRGELTWDELVGVYRIEQIEDQHVLYFGGSPISRVVVEDFVNDPRVKRGGQRNGASEVIGAVEILARQGGAEFVRRDRSTLHAAKLHAGYVLSKSHLPHKDAAYVHGYSDFVMRGILPALGVDYDMLE